MAGSVSSLDRVPLAERIEVFHLQDVFKADTCKHKVDLIAGVYRTEEGHPYVLPVVRRVEQSMASNPDYNHEYLPLLGYTPFCEAAVGLLYGHDHEVIEQGRVLSVQGLGGSGSIRLGAFILGKLLKRTIVYISDPTWGNHGNIFLEAGFKEVRKYRYWHGTEKRLDIEGMLTDLKAAPEGSVVILHSNAHNPTGIDPNHNQWKQICSVIQGNKLHPFFDMAYQGFSSGDPDKDAWAVRYFGAQPALELYVAQSFAKNFGIYNERTGCLSVVVNNQSVLEPLRTQISRHIRATISNPPNHGCKIVHAILTNQQLKAQWLQELQAMVGRLYPMREALKQALQTLDKARGWSHITEQTGMFAYLGLTRAQCEYMRMEHHVYVLNNGRANMFGVNKANVQAVAHAIHDATIHA